MEINKEIIFMDFPPIKIDEETRKKVIENPSMYLNCPPRIRMGKFYTDEEKEAYVKKSLKRPLPGEKKKGLRLLFRRKNNQ